MAANNPSHARATGRGPDSSPLLHSLVLPSLSFSLDEFRGGRNYACLAEHTDSVAQKQFFEVQQHHANSTNSQKRQHPAESNSSKKEGSNQTDSNTNKKLTENNNQSRNLRANIHRKRCRTKHEAPILHQHVLQFTSPEYFRPDNNMSIHEHLNEAPAKHMTC
ncbi:unnamed protein product [Ectocarpus sp. 8 AP-2014]